MLVNDVNDVNVCVYFCSLIHDMPWCSIHTDNMMLIFEFWMASTVEKGIWLVASVTKENTPRCHQLPSLAQVPFTEACEPAMATGRWSISEWSSMCLSNSRKKRWRSWFFWVISFHCLVLLVVIWDMAIVKDTLWPFLSGARLSPLEAPQLGLTQWQ